MLINSINNSLNELVDLLNQISDSEYSKPCQELSSATIGEHTRHILEMFQCLENQYDSGIVNYDNRNRNKIIEQNSDFAINEIQKIKINLDRHNKKINLHQVIDGEEILIESNYNRELLYNLEHCIHHQALIKVAILMSENIKIGANFGVARSTIEYRNQCVQ